MRCTNCQFENPSGARFCEECGQRLAQICPQCGSASSPTAKFCRACGALLADTAAAPARLSSPVTPLPYGAANFLRKLLL
ncbi:MAG: double zinc ribbon domain-containing protein [Pseudomonadales bacterium]